jgi:hypothetical protein
LHEFEIDLDEPSRYLSRHPPTEPYLGQAYETRSDGRSEIESIIHPFGIGIYLDDEREATFVNLSKLFVDCVGALRESFGACY